VVAVGVVVAVVVALAVVVVVAIVVVGWFWVWGAVGVALAVVFVVEKGVVMTVKKPSRLEIAEANIDKILGAITAGKPIRHACQLFGTTDIALRKLRNARPEIDDQVMLAEARRDATVVDALFEAAKADPQVALRWLAKRRPDEWDLEPTSRTQINVGGQHVHVDDRRAHRLAAAQRLSLDELRALDAEWAAREEGDDDDL
jgi:hypothetical protein